MKLPQEYNLRVYNETIQSFSMALFDKFILP